MDEAIVNVEDMNDHIQALTDAIQNFLIAGTLDKEKSPKTYARLMRNAKYEAERARTLCPLEIAQSEWIYHILKWKEDGE